MHASLHIMASSHELFSNAIAMIFLRRQNRSRTPCPTPAIPLSPQGPFPPNPPKPRPPIEGPIPPPIPPPIKSPATLPPPLNSLSPTDGITPP